MGCAISFSNPQPPKQPSAEQLELSLMAIPKTVYQIMIFLTGSQQIRFAARLFNPRSLLRGDPFIPLFQYPLIAGIRLSFQRQKFIIQ